MTRTRTRNSRTAPKKPFAAPDAEELLREQQELEAKLAAAKKAVVAARSYEEGVNVIDCAAEAVAVGRAVMSAFYDALPGAESPDEAPRYLDVDTLCALVMESVPQLIGGDGSVPPLTDDDARAVNYARQGLVAEVYPDGL